MIRQKDGQQCGDDTDHTTGEIKISGIFKETRFERPEIVVAPQETSYDEEAAQAALQQHLPGAKVLSVMHYDWVNDPYSRGTWATYRTGWVAKYYDQFQKESGRVFFGSGDHGEGWRGTIDSAIGAGSIAARKVSELLS